MKREKGFSLIELLVAMAILLVVVSVATGVIIQAQHVSEGVALEANVQENLRAAMHFLVRDLTQAGEGIPAAGISIPNTAAGVSNVVAAWHACSEHFSDPVPCRRSPTRFCLP